jgi:3-phosphoshikimate 1-carboxyvinyltransferase
MTLRSRALGSLRGTPRLPGDKSITHRAVLLGALASGTTRVENANPGGDCAATLRAIEALGVTVRRDSAGWELEGAGGMFRPPAAPLDLGNSGTTLRLLLGLLAAQPFAVTLIGDSSLSRRPVERLLEPLRRMGAEAVALGDHPPVSLRGGLLQGIRHDMAVPSAQVKSALLLAGIQARGTTWIGGTRGTRDHTERMLRGFGVQVDHEETWVSVAGGQLLTGRIIRIPGDLSAAVFYLVAAAICPGSDLVLDEVGLNPTRTRVLDVLTGMGVQLEITSADPAETEPRGRLRVRGPDRLEPFTLDAAEVPWLIDELPALAVAAVFAQGISQLSGAGELRVKESDRLEAMAQGLRAVGARITVTEDGWRIEGSGGIPLQGGRAMSRGDHRVAMALLVAGFRTRTGVDILDDPLVDTSDPHFPRNLRQFEELSA